MNKQEQKIMDRHGVDLSCCCDKEDYAKVIINVVRSSEYESVTQDSVEIILDEFFRVEGVMGGKGHTWYKIV